MRPLKDVMKAILNIIPDGYDHKKEIQARVKSISTSVDYAAPELMPMWWNEFAVLLLNYFPWGDSDRYPWLHTINDVMADKIDYHEHLKE